uniref:Thrombospondin type laminin G domain and EAR repeats n=1 Tax=Oryzias latipes TaxID=8090 RepID=A0A3P9HIB4_ORYLA
LDLLSRALASPGQSLPTQVKHRKGFRVTGTMATAMSFPASQIFTNCNYFPAEFSLVATLKILRLKHKTSEYIFSMVKEGPDLLLLGLLTGDHPPCSKREHGQLWFNTQSKGLFICDGLMWRTLLQSKERLDYVEDYQDLYTRSKTLDIEVFSIPSEGLFMAAPLTCINKSEHGDHKRMFTELASFDLMEPELSVIYRWNKRRRRFVRYQALETHGAQDWEAFQIHNNSFLVVANHRGRDSYFDDRNLFEVNQTLQTTGAFDWEFFTVGPYHFLVVANTFDGRTTTISSTIYVWLDGHFKSFQNITTVGATDWEAFQIDGRFFLVVANSHKFADTGQSLYSLNSTLLLSEQYHLQVCGIHSNLQVWQGHEGFVPVHSLPTFGCRDWEHFRTDEGSFLIYSSATSRLSKVFRLRTY